MVSFTRSCSLFPSFLLLSSNRSCGWRHLKFSSEARDRFVACTGVKAAMRHLEAWNIASFVLSTLLAPLGYAYFPISMALEKYLEKVCEAAPYSAEALRQAELNANFRGQTIPGKLSYLSPTLKKAISFVIDYLLKPVYNFLRLGGKLGVKPFANGAKAIRPYLKQSSKVEDQMEDFCEKISPFQKFLRR